jgi:beta-xylosidase
MADYHVFSSENLTDWTDHGVILDQKDVPWGDPKAYSMWAPDAIEKDGKYYFYFPTRRRGAESGEAGFSIGVAIADNPEGPYVPQAEPIEGVVGIDPNVFIDEDGQAYFYWSRDKIYGAKLKDNMLELASEPKIFNEIPKKGHIEGPFVFEREGIYYLTYPHVANNTERLEYATGKDPLGPFTHRGVIMDESPTGVWTNHHSIVEFKDQWYLFYHHNELSPDFDKNRSIMADSLFFNPDGTIQKVIPTLRGVGLTKATDKIQVDRYSDKSANAAIDFNDPDNTFEGWHVTLEGPSEWIKYNSVSFSEDLRAVKVKAASEAGGTLQVRLNDRNGTLISEIDIPKSNDWNVVEAEINDFTPGEYHLVLIMKKGAAKVDWLRFTE